MAELPTLATLADLQASRVAYDDDSIALVMLERASAAIRDAAGTTITRATSTIRFATERSMMVELPVKIVTQIHQVLLNGEPVTDYRHIAGGLWLTRLWHETGATPGVIEVTLTHGLPTVPADIISLTCSLAAAGLAAAAGGYDPGRGITYERIGDYQYGKANGASELLDPFQLPDATRKALRKRFSGTRPYVIGSHR